MKIALPIDGITLGNFTISFGSLAFGLAAAVLVAAVAIRFSFRRNKKVGDL